MIQNTSQRKPSATKILVISQDLVGPQMAGPGIRSFEFARLLGETFRVTLAVPAPAPSLGAGFRIVSYDESQPAELQAAAAEADVVIAGGYLLRAFPFLLNINGALVIDAYIPYPLEALELNSQYSPLDQRAALADAILTLNLQFMAGDFFLCASERQRDLWLGLMLAQGRINPDTYSGDRTLRGLIDTVPYGLPDQPPRRVKPVLRGVHPAVSDHDRVVLWGGGIWQWLDPLTLIRAAAMIKDQIPDLRVFFPGTRHPYAAAVPDMEMRHAALRLSDELGLTDQAVIFGDWIPYEDRQSYLLEADVGVSLHLDTVETRFAFRTRILDYIWAELPILASRGDFFSELIEEHDLGRLVAAEDVEGVAAALLDLLERGGLRAEMRPRFRTLAQCLTWAVTCEPLVRFCRAPLRSADRQSAGTGLYSAWISGLLQEARSSSRAQITHLEQHVGVLHEQIKNLEQHVQQQARLIDDLTTPLPIKAYRELRRRLGRAS